VLEIFVVVYLERKCFST